MSARVRAWQYRRTHPLGAYSCVPLNPRYDKRALLRVAWDSDALSAEVAWQVELATRGRASTPREVEVLQEWSAGERARVWDLVCEWRRQAEQDAAGASEGA